MEKAAKMKRSEYSALDGELKKQTQELEKVHEFEEKEESKGISKKPTLKNHNKQI